MFEKFWYWLEDDFSELFWKFVTIVALVLSLPLWGPLWLLWFLVFRKKGKGHE